MAAWQDACGGMEVMAMDVLDMCEARRWDMHWTCRGAYLHLEASELIESIRGKGSSSPVEEAADVLIVLMSITQSQGIRFRDVLRAASVKVDGLVETADQPYPGEERSE